MKRHFFKPLLAMTVAFSLGTAVAQDVKEHTFKFGLQNPKGHPLELGAVKFAEVVAAKSGGKIKINVFPGGTLGSQNRTS